MAADVPPVVVKSSPAVSIESGPFEFRMMSRLVNQDHGGTLEVYGRLERGPRELLKFDCFEQAPHWHRCYPDRKDEITQLAPMNAAQALDFAVETLRTSFGSLIAEQGYGELSEPASGADVRAALTGVAQTMAELVQRDPATL
jgi:hypothetical protein